MRQITDSLPDTVTLRAAAEAELRTAPEAVLAAAEAALGVLERRCADAHRVVAGETVAAEVAAIELTAIAAYAEDQDEVTKRNAALRDEAQQRGCSQRATSCGPA